MKHKIVTPNITQYQFLFEPGDEFYSACGWARINLEHEKYVMMANSDCGSYSYTWAPTPDTESFRQLMARVDREYLLGKIADPRFDFEKSKAELFTRAEQENMAGPVLEDITSMLWCGEGSYMSYASKITGWGYDCIPVERVYATNEITFARIFTEVLQPILKQELSHSLNPFS